MKKIAIIEDDRVVAGIYQNKLSAEAFTVEAALDGESGLALVKRWEPDVLVLDLMLPKLNGVEIIKQLRAQVRFLHLPILVLSNSYLPNFVKEAWRVGATTCLVKSECTPRKLIEIINGLPPKVPETPVVEPPPVVAPPLPGQGAPSSIPEQHQDETALRAEFLARCPEFIKAFRSHLLSFNKAANEPDRLGALQQFYEIAHSFTSNAAVSGLTKISRLGAAFEAFIRELIEKPSNINPSSIRTMAQVVDFTSELIKRPDVVSGGEFPKPAILVVDDEPISRRAVSMALDRAGLSCLSLGDAANALQTIGDNRFDLIILDVDMPGMDGFELCKRIRSLPEHAHTPVVFVTGLTDFQSRAKSTLSGGNDLIGKPFVFMELAVKALMYILKEKMVFVH